MRPHVSLSWLHRHEYVEKNWSLLILTIAITMGSPFLGLVLAGVIGAMVGLVISLAGAVIGFFAITKVRHEKEGGV